MTKIFSRILLLFALSAAILLTQTACLNKTDLLKADKVNPRSYDPQPLEYEIPQPQMVDLDGGATALMMESRDIPLLRLQIFIHAGTVYDPLDKAGLAEITGDALTSAGTERFSSDEFSQRLEYLGARMHSGTYRESFSLSLEVATKHTEEALELLDQALFHPVFEPAKIEIIKERMAEGLQRLPDSPFQLALRKFRKAIYAGNPRSNLYSRESIQNISDKDIKTFYLRYFYPANMVLAVAGDFETEKMQRRLNQMFSPDEKDTPMEIITPPPPIKSRQIYLVPKDIEQTTIILGHLTIGSKDADYVSLKAMNQIIGGGSFNSRLMQEVRSNRGLAYSVNSFYSENPDFGIWGAVSQTKSESAVEALKLILSIIENVKTEGVNSEELEWAKDSMQNSFIFGFDTSFAVASQYAGLAFDQMPLDWLDEYQAKLKAIDMESVNTAAAKYLQPQKVIIVLVGPENELKESLSDLGEVTICPPGTF